MQIGKLYLQSAQSYPAQMCMVGPYEARELLKLNTFNRKKSERCIEKYVREMLAGEWVATASGIGIDEDGVLTDGQNRLEAIVRYNGTIPLLVVTGLPRLARSKVDRHNKRSISAALYLAGLTEKDDRNSIQVANFLAALVNGGQPADCDVAASWAVHRNSISRIEKMITQHKKGISQVGVRAALTLAHEIYGEKVCKFVEQLNSDYHSRADDPTLRLRKVLMFETCSRKPTKGGSQQMWAFERTVYAFNAWIQGRYINSVMGCRDIVRV